MVVSDDLFFAVEHLSDKPTMGILFCLFYDSECWFSIVTIIEMKRKIFPFIVFELLKNSLVVFYYLLECLDNLMLWNICIYLRIDVNLVSVESRMLNLEDHFEGLLIQIDMVSFLVDVPQQYILVVSFLNLKPD